MSKTAVAGFVCGLVLCVPAAPLVGLALGIVGVVGTSGGRQRGRGLAIAAIPISLVTLVVQLWMGLFGYIFWRYSQSIRQEITPAVRVALKASATQVPESAAALYRLTSKRFQNRVSAARFQEWVEQTVTRQGQLQALRPGAKRPERYGQDQWMIRYVGRFVKGEAAIDILCGATPRYTLEIDDIRVDGVSPIGD